MTDTNATTGAKTEGQKKPRRTARPPVPLEDINIAAEEYRGEGIKTSPSTGAAAPAAVATAPAAKRKPESRARRMRAADVPVLPRPEQKVPVQFKCSNAMIDRMDKRAVELGINRTELITWAVERFLGMSAEEFKSVSFEEFIRIRAAAR